jgi:tetratricopeptide (TPR) repeat protein
MNREDTQSESGPETVEELAETLKKCLKTGDYSFTLREQARRLNSLLEESPPTIRATDRDFLKRKCMISEVLDYFGLYEETATEVVKEETAAAVAQEIHRHRKRDHRTTKLDMQKLAREQARFRLEYAQVLYRKHQYADAKPIIEECQDFIEKYVRSEPTVPSSPTVLSEPEFPCFGTRARCAFYLARVCRQLNEYDKAEQFFVEAIGFQERRAEQAISNSKTDPESKRELEGELQFARHKSAIATALGLGWLAYTRGALARAKSYIEPARVLLLSSNDVVNRAYIELVDAAIDRALAGHDRTKLLSSVEPLQKSLTIFKEYDHLSYVARARAELFLAFLYAKDFSRAQEELNEAEKLARGSKDQRWIRNCQIYRSRMVRLQARDADVAMRDQFAVAERLASQALENSDSPDQPLCQIDAFIARSEARIELEQYELAREDLAAALRINSDCIEHPGDARFAENTNPKIEAVCNLLMARCFVRERNSWQAELHLKKWEMFKHIVEHVSVRELAAAVEVELQTLRAPFKIDPDTGKLSFPAQQRELFHWLLREAKRRFPEKKEEQNKLLEINRQTRGTWERKCRDSGMPDT